MADCNSWEKNEKLSQYTKILKIIFTIQKEKKIDMCVTVVYYVHKGKSTCDDS